MASCGISHGINEFVKCAYTKPGEGGGDVDYIWEYGIMFLDINMEGMDGLEAARQIKAECPKVLIVLVTAGSS